jgi:hypothetical protein
MYYIEDEDGNAIKADNMHEWSIYFKSDKRVVKKTLWKEKCITVSSVFLGIDHSCGDDNGPILYETMVFGGCMDDECYRYKTRQETLEAHDKIVRSIAFAEDLNLDDAIVYYTLRIKK